MTRLPSQPLLLRCAIAVALCATLAMTGCKKKDAAAVTATPTAEPAATPAPAPAPAAATLTVTSVELGNAIGADNRIANPVATFARTDAIHASVATDGPGGSIGSKWMMGNTLVHAEDKTVAAGPQVTEFSITKPDGWPVGHYTLQVLVAGNAVQTRAFDVR